MNKDCDVSNGEEDVEVTLDPHLVSRFLTECEGGLMTDDVDAETRSVFITEETKARAFTSTLRRPSFYQRSIDLGIVGSPDDVNMSGAKPAKYVSEIRVTLSAQPDVDDVTEISQTQPKQEQNGKEPKPVEYISGIHVTRSTSGNQEETYPASDVITRFRKEKSAAIISNFLTKLTKDPSTVLKSTPFLKKTLVSRTTDESLVPSNEISHLTSSNEDFSPTITGVFAPAEMSSEIFTREVTTMTSTTNQTLSMSGYTQSTVHPEHVMPTSEIRQGNASFTSLTKKVSSTFDHNVDSIIQQSQNISSSSYEIRTGPPKASSYSNVEDLPPPLPDLPPPLPSQPPPSLLRSGHTVASITPEEADFITVYLKSLKTVTELEGSMDTSIFTFPKSIHPVSTELYSKHQEEKPKLDVATTQTTVTSVVTKKAPKILRSPGLPVWPPPPRTESPPPKGAELLTSVSSDSSSSSSQWEDAEDVELRDQAGRDVKETTTPGKSDSGYSGSNASSHISWSLPEDGTSSGPAPGDKESPDKLEDGQDVVPQRPSILELLRSNSDAGRKSKPRWHKSVDSDVILEGLSEKKLQLLELEFEMITTEAEYFSRVEFLKKNFLVPNARYNKKDTLNSDSKKNIFLDLDEVCGCSEKLLADLDKCWQKSVYLEGIFNVVKEHSKANISTFINYCAEYEGVIGKINVLRKEDRKFEELVSGLEEGKPDLTEQLKAPMNRIIQLNLLLKNCQDVMTHLSKTEDLTDGFTNEYESCRSATESVAQLCAKVDEVTGMRRRVQKIIEIQECLEFPLQMTQLSLASQNRWLVKKGAVTQNGYLILNTGKKPAFKKSASVLTVFLFNDLIILTKKKSEECHVVKDYGQRPGVQMSLAQGMEALPRRLVEDSPGYYTLFLSIAKNHMGGTAHIFLSCAIETERNDWLDAMTKTSDEYHGL